MADLSEYMTPAEFANLGSAAHHAVWAAHGEGRIDAASRTATPGSPLVYNRAQVRALLRETAVAR